MKSLEQNWKELLSKLMNIPVETFPNDLEGIVNHANNYNPKYTQKNIDKSK